MLVSTKSIAVVRLVTSQPIGGAKGHAPAPDALQSFLFTPPQALVSGLALGNLLQVSLHHSRHRRAQFGRAHPHTVIYFVGHGNCDVFHFHSIGFSIG